MISVDALFGKDARVLLDPRFQLLLLASLVPPLGSGAISPVLGSLTVPFGVSDTEIGLMVSAMTAPGIVMIPAAGVLADRYGRKPILLAGLLLFGAGGLAIPLTTDFRVVLALRLVQGFGFAGINPAVITSVGDLYDGDREATAQGLRFTTTGVALVVFPVVAGTLVALSWRSPFLLYALPLPLAVLVLWWFEEPADVADATDEGVEPPGPSIGRLLRLAAAPRVAAVVIARGLPVLVFIGFVTYNSIFVERLMGGTPRGAGLLLGISAVAWSIAASQAGRLSAIVESQVGILSVANLLVGGGFAIIAFAPGLPTALGGAALLGVGFGITMSLYRSLITGFAPASLRGGLVSLAETVGRVSITATPIAMGLAVEATRPTLGFAGALRWVSLAVALIGGLGGVACMLVMGAASPPDIAPD